MDALFLRELLMVGDVGLLRPLPQWLVVALLGGGGEGELIRISAVLYRDPEPVDVSDIVDVVVVRVRVQEPGGVFRCFEE